MFHRLAYVVFGCFLAINFSVLSAPVPVPKDERSPEEIQAARDDLRLLRRRAADPQRDPSELWKLWARFCMRHPASPEYMQAAEVMSKVPSPLDKLDRSQIPAEDLTPWLPKEVVAVLGDQRGRSWSGFGRLSFSRDGKLLLSGGQAWDADTLREQVNPLKGLVMAPDGKRAAILRTVKSPEAKRHLYFDTSICLLEIRGDKRVVLAEIQRECHGLDHLAWSQDGRFLLASGQICPFNRRGKELVRRGVVQQTIVCEIKDNKLCLLHEIDVEASGGSQAAFAIGGKYLLDNGGERKGLRLWDVREEKPRLCATIPNVCQREFTLSADGRTLALPQPSRLRGINAQMATVWTLTEAGPQRPRFFEGTWPDLGVMRFSPDGTLLACLAPEARGIWLCPLTEARRRELGMDKTKDSKYYPLTFTLDGLQFYPDSNKLAIGGTDGIIHIWDWKNGEKVIPHVGHHGWVSDISFSPDGRCLASASGDGTIRLWEWRDGGAREHARVDTDRPVRKIAFAPDGETLAAYADGIPDRKDAEKAIISFWNVNKERPVRQGSLEPLSEDKRFGCMAFAAGGKTLLTVVDGKDPLNRDRSTATACFWDYASSTPSLLSRINLEEYVEKKEDDDSTDVYISSMRLSPIGKQLVFISGRREQSVNILERRGESWRKASEVKFDVREGVYCAAFSPDGNMLIIGGVGQREGRGVDPFYSFIRFWRIRGRLGEARPSLNEDGESIVQLVVSPNGRRIAALGGNRITIWDIPTNRKLIEWQLPLFQYNFAFRSAPVQFAPDGRHLATANSNGTVYVFRIPEQSGKP
jgi:WD40 repeat protein